MSEGFDRVRPRAAAASFGAPVDVQGKSALFSGDVVAPPPGSVVITCSGCHQASTVSYSRAVRLALPSVHVPVRREHGSWMRCPACAQRHWVRIRLR